MIKLSEVIYNKIVVQAEEAELLGFTDLSKNINQAVKEANVISDNSYQYSRKELSEDVKCNIWKSALAVIGYHNLNSIDVGRLSEVIDDMADKVSDAIEEKLNVKNQLGPMDKLPGVK
jgi:hypothetical protein